MTFPDLTEAQVNTILTALGQRPYVEVANLLDMIVTHINAQKKPMVEPVTVGTP